MFVYITNDDLTEYCDTDGDIFSTHILTPMGPIKLYYGTPVKDSIPNPNILSSGIVGIYIKEEDELKLKSSLEISEEILFISEEMITDFENLDDEELKLKFLEYLQLMEKEY